MYDYSLQIEAFRDSKVRLPQHMLDMLYAHRQANRNRLISRIDQHIPKARISDTSFKPQGSVAMGTVIQTKFSDEEYDVDDGLLIPRSQLVKKDGSDMSSTEVRQHLRNALEDARFNRQPELFTNCVRVFYADTDEEKHHLDIPVYRVWRNTGGEEIRELANEEKWIPSNPTQVNTWLEGIVQDRNAIKSGWGTQFRQHVQLMKRFCRSREAWLEELPNGMKLTMLVAECLPAYDERIDIAFRELLRNLKRRLEYNLAIQNLAHPDKPLITRSTRDTNVVNLGVRVTEALDRLNALDLSQNFNENAAREAWEWVFQSDGFFDDYAEAMSEGLLSEARALKIVAKAPWKEVPHWNFNISGSVTLTGKYREKGETGSWTQFPSNGTPLKKNCDLRFSATTSLRPPFDVYWQVVNTGKAAAKARALRGQVIRSKTAGAGGLQSTTVDHIESTLYKGMHWVECYIVRGRDCVARSGPFIVNIE